MKGPIFSQLLSEKEGKVSRREVHDLETMYTLILQALGTSEAQLEAQVNEEDERFALAFLCEVHWPGKEPPYRRTISDIKAVFSGIARNPAKQRDFLQLVVIPSLFSPNPRDEKQFKQINKILRQVLVEALP
jgi:hypothetical protein